MLSGSSVEPDSTDVTIKAINKKLLASGENALLDFRVRERPLPPFRGGRSKSSERGSVDSVVGQVAQFNLTPESLFMLMV